MPASLQCLVAVVLLACAAAAVNLPDHRTSFPSVSVKEDISAYTSYTGIKTPDLEVAFRDGFAEFELAKHNLSSADEVYKLDFLQIAEVRRNGSFVTRPLSLDSGKWRVLKTQSNGQTAVASYSVSIFVSSRTVTISLLLAIARNDSKFYSPYNTTQLEKDQVKFAILIENWPFDDEDNMLNLTLSGQSNKHNSTKSKSVDDTLSWVEFGETDDDDSTVLHVSFEDTVLVDDRTSDNITVWMDDETNKVTVSLPHHDRFVYYDPVVTLQSPESSSSSSHTTLIIVLCVVGGVILLVCVALIVFFIWRRRRASYEVIE